MSDVAKEVTQLLKELRGGNEAAVDKLVPLLYGELRHMAAAYLSRERRDHTLQPTAVVHEAYLRLVEQKEVQWQNRQHFFGVAAQAMRRVLVDHARRHQSLKRGGEAGKISLESAMVAANDRSAELVAVDEALTRLAAVDPQQARIVELRFFGGLTVDETAKLTGISPATVKRDWNVAKAWLTREIGKVKRSDERKVGAG
jgi:RNA polymerase sigma factor (TIGR02999 family)